MRRFGNYELVRQLAQSISPRLRRWKSAFTVVGIALVALSLAGPRFGTKLREFKREGVDLVIALDGYLSDPALTYHIVYRVLELQDGSYQPDNHTQAEQQAGNKRDEQEQEDDEPSADDGDRRDVIIKHKGAEKEQGNCCKN